MLFKNVNKLTEKNEKKFFIEKINIINELVKKYCLKENIDFNAVVADEDRVFAELVKIGFIENKEDIGTARKILGREFDVLRKSLTIYSQQNWQFLNKFYNSYRQEEQTKSSKSDKPKIIDLFCGAGGFSLGFIQEGYKVELANDIEPVALETYKYNHPDISTDKILSGDIKEIVNNIDNHVDTDIDVIIGGPPCQSFSSANQQRVIDDPRNVLYTYYVKAVEKIQPKFVLMENVRGMIKVADQVVEDFNRIGYDVEYRLFDSSEFSVAQKRVRLLYIGVNRVYAKKHNITPSQLMKEVESEIKNKPRYVLKDALENIKPLECPTIKNTTEIDCELSGKKIDINIYKNKSNDYMKLVNNNKEFDFTFNHKARYQNENNIKIYKTLQQGADSTCESIKDIMPYSHRNHVFKDKYFKLIENEPSRTITAHMKMDCHSHIHPSQTRSLTPREAARVQSFPDDYIFMGAYLKTYMQIGNAVPPLMSQVFAKIFKNNL
ncbi:DNA cytosine methyltransferase [Sulfurovum sp. AR]|uniref:DNA cytosine methyltransferase n=1 Tax=Sulfurovum sp. AR TaxID=1165841 RepID=UPI00025C4D40|nr:DNA cytosine methyltransferase [Sulfurovum sp. AR]EIF51380.1 two-component sensor [Sulfurovum sp. AR]